jgi:hypothetical protein
VDLSNNKIDDPASGQMISSVLDVTSSLKTLRLANCNLTPDTAQHVVRAFGANAKLQDRYLDIGNNPLPDRGEILVTPLQGSFGFQTLNLSGKILSLWLNFSSLSRFLTSFEPLLPCYVGLKLRDVPFIDILTVLQQMPSLTTLILDNAPKGLSPDKAEETARLLTSVLSVNPGIKALSLSGGFGKGKTPMMNQNSTLLFIFHCAPYILSSIFLSDPQLSARSRYKLHSS